MSDYKLGDKVRILGCIEKRRRTLYGDGHKNDVHYENTSVPHRKVDKMVNGTWITEQRPFETGIIIGSRTISDYGVDSEYSDWGGGRITWATPVPGTHREVYLVAFDMRRRPIMCLPGQINRETS